MLTLEECKQVTVFLNRASLQGNEAATLVHLMQRLGQEAELASVQPAPSPEPVVPTPPIQ